jgi:hypothetical protein
VTTATPTRTLADVYSERLAAQDPTDRLLDAIEDAIHSMVPYTGDERDLRPSEEKWLGDRLTEAADAAKAAVIATVADLYGRELPRLLPSANDPTVPAHLWEQGPDELREDVELLERAPA